MGERAGEPRLKMNAFFDMGGYGFYVWTAYTVTLIVLVLNLLIPMFRNRRLLRRLSARPAREQRP